MSLPSNPLLSKKALGLLNKLDSSIRVEQDDNWKETSPAGMARHAGAVDQARAELEEYIVELERWFDDSGNNGRPPKTITEQEAQPNPGMKLPTSTST